MMQIGNITASLRSEERKKERRENFDYRRR